MTYKTLDILREWYRTGITPLLTLNKARHARAVLISHLKQFFQQSAMHYLAIGAIVLLTVVMGGAPAIAASHPSSGATIPDITVYRDPSCRCCGGWMDHLTAEGFHATNVPTADMDALKQQHGVLDRLSSCHTAIVDGYVIEGHVPAEDIKRLLATRPHVKGIAVPDMPIGTPGMESGDERESFTVFSFDENGNTEVFSQHTF